MTPPVPSTRMFQIPEDDLEVLERELPNLLWHAMGAPWWNERKDIQEAWSMVKGIVSNVRWNYGPPSRVERIENTGGNEEGGSEPA